MNLDAIIAGRLIYWAEQICQQVRQKWPMRQPYPAITGKKEITHELITTPQAVMVELIASGQAAWEIEFGKGSGMSADNPYLQEYIHGGQWNPERSDTAIRGRPAGEYKDLDGIAYTSNGKMAGRNLEDILWRGKRHDMRFAPTMPMHVIRDEIEFTWPLIVADIANAVNTAVSEEIVYSLTKDIYI